MMHSHVSELAIDRLLAGELPPADATSLRDHAAACPRCSAALDDALGGQASALPPLRLPRRRAAVAMTMMAACAATVAVVLVWPHPREDLVRTKGSAIAGFFVAHGEQVRRGAQREQVNPGDRVELFTTTTEPAWFAAIGDDGTVFVAPRAVMPGRETVLPIAIELDGTLGDEVVTGMFCPAPFDPHAPPAECTSDRFTLVVVPR